MSSRCTILIYTTLKQFFILKQTSEGRCTILIYTTLKQDLEGKTRINSRCTILIYTTLKPQIQLFESIYCNLSAIPSIILTFSQQFVK